MDGSNAGVVELGIRPDELGFARGRMQISAPDKLIPISLGEHVGLSGYSLPSEWVNSDLESHAPWLGSHARSIKPIHFRAPPGSNVLDAKRLPMREVITHRLLAFAKRNDYLRPAREQRPMPFLLLCMKY